VSESENRPKVAIVASVASVVPAARAWSRTSHRVRVVLAFAVIYVIWGSTYLGIRIAVASIPPFLMAGSRYFLAGAILFAVLRGLGVTAPTAREWRHATIGGLLMLTVGNGMVSWAEQSVPSNLAALLVAAVPLYTALLDWGRPGGRRPERPALIGISVGFAGMLLLALPDRRALGAPSGAGVIAILIAGLGWALGTLYARYARRHANSIMASAQQMIAGGTALLLVGAGRGELARFSPAAITAHSALAFVYLTLVGSLLAFSAFGWLVAVSSPALLSTTAYVNPVVAVSLGWLLLGERLAPRALAGATLIIAAVVIMTMAAASIAWVQARWTRKTARRAERFLD
jgi:drug/metabolite transporter (DMT)-like permease